MESTEYYTQNAIDKDHGLREIVIGAAFEVMGELGVGFLESIYTKAMFQVLRVFFKGKPIGIYRADLIAENRLVIELKCCKAILPEHKAQVINYLKATGIKQALLFNFGNSKIEFCRLYI